MVKLLNLASGLMKGRVGQYVARTTRSSKGTRSTILQAYQALVSNPKTYGQMYQRAKFANAVKFYKKAVNNFFRFAYEDKKGNESDYNAFMRHNIEKSVLLKKNVVDDAYLPAWGNRWIMSYGSLPNFYHGWSEVKNDGGSIRDLHFNVHVKTGSSMVVPQTIGELSTLLKQYNDLQDGDIITIVAVNSIATQIDYDMAGIDDAHQPTWQIFQFIVDTTEKRAISDMVFTGGSVATIGMSSTAEGPGLSTSGSWESILTLDFNKPNYSNWATVIITRRKGTSQELYATTSELEGNSVVTACLNSAKGVNYENEVVVSWGGKPNAILQGAITRFSGTALAEPEITTIIIDGVEKTDMTSLNYVPESMTITLKGTNLTNRALNVDYVGAEQISPFTTATLSNAASVASDGTEVTYQLEKNEAIDSLAEGTYSWTIDYASYSFLEMLVTVQGTEVTTVNGTAIPATISELGTVTVGGTNLSSAIEPVIKTGGDQLAISNWKVASDKKSGTFTLNYATAPRESYTGTIYMNDKLIANVSIGSAG